MKDGTKDRNHGFWNRFAFLYPTMQIKKNGELYEELCRHVRHYIRKEHSVLELACGSGEMTYELSHFAKDWTAADYAENMIRECLKRPAPGVRYEVADATALPYADESFDIVIMANALHIMPSPEKALKEIRRVLKPDGLLIAPTFVYEGHINHFRLRIMNAAGFRTYFKWTSGSYRAFFEEHGWRTEECILLPTHLITECFMVVR